MKRILVLILMILLIILALVIILNGFTLGDFKVLSFKNLGNLNGQLEKKIEEASTLTSVTFPEKMSSLTTASKQLVTTKEKYQDKVAYSSEEDVRKANEIETYNVDFLFTRLGNHAKKYGLVIDLDAKRASASGVYNLNFTVHGKYALIADFVRAVEDDKELTFTIENFILTPDTNTETLKAEFIVSELRLDIDENISNAASSVPMGNSGNKNNTTNNTTSNTTNNTTNNTTTNSVTNNTQTNNVTNNTITQ